MSAAAALVVFTQAIAGQNNPVVCSNSSDTGVASRVWTVETKPSGSSIPIGPIGVDSTATFTPDVQGTYGVKLTVTGTDGIVVSNTGSYSTGLTTKLAVPYLQDAAVLNSGTTVVCNGEPRVALYTVTVPVAAWSAAAVTKDLTLLTIPAKSKIKSIIADTTAAYNGAGTCAITVGISAGDNKYLVSHDVKSAIITVGVADADFGTLLTRAGAINGGSFPSWASGGIVSARMTSGSGNTSTFTTGSTTFYIVLEHFA